jgi:hypothetical protein
MRKHAALVRDPVSKSSCSTAEGLPTALNSAGQSDASVLRATDTTTSAVCVHARHGSSGDVGT